MSYKKSCAGLNYSEYYANKRYECITKMPVNCIQPIHVPVICNQSICAPFCNSSSKPVYDILMGKEKPLPTQTYCNTTPVNDILAYRCKC